MKRRDFIKTGICLGCAGSFCSGISAFGNPTAITNPLPKTKFLYKSNDELPTKVKLDICNLCQLNCAACWVRRDEKLIKEYGGGFGYVPFETYKDFIEKHPFIKQIELSHSGEMFLNPELEDIIRYSNEKGVQLFASNGVNFNTVSDSVLEALVKYQFIHMTVSIDATTPRVYRIYRRGGNFNTVINNIKKLNKIKEKYNSELPVLTYKFVLFGHNEHQIEDAKKLAKELNMNILFELNIVESYSPLKNPEKVYELTGLRSQKNEIENCMAEHLEEYIVNDNSWFSCKDLWVSPQINYNGDMLGCCCQLFPHYDTNVFRDGLLNSMNSQKMLYAKSMLTDLSVPSQEDIICSECWMYNVLKEKNIPLSGV